MALGKSKKEDFNSEMAKEMAVRETKKRNPLMSKKKIRKVANQVDKNMKKQTKKGIGL